MANPRLTRPAPARISGLAFFHRIFSPGIVLPGIVLLGIVLPGTSFLRGGLPGAGIGSAFAETPRPTAGALPTAGSLDDHQAAVAALTGLKAAITELVQVDASYSTDKNVYRDASQRAINLLAGEHGAGYVAGSNPPADTTGAIGHVDALLDRQATPVWAMPLRGAEANMRVAVLFLQDSLKGRELADYQVSASRALTYLEVARGRPTEAGVLGGLEGALANTALGVPAGGKQVDACAAPTDAPAYGIHGGYLGWVALPGGDGSHPLAEAPGGTELVVHGGLIILHTAVAAMVTGSCSDHADAATQAVSRPRLAAASQPPAQASPHPNIAEAQAQHAPAGEAQPALDGAAGQAAAGDGSGQPATQSSEPVPPLYTMAQAQEGAQIFAGKCARCHGENLLGTAAPSVAGTDFLRTAKQNGWTLAMIRYLVVNNMPMNAPDSLSPSQYASVLAFLLASNCYPAGGKAFPTSADPSFANVKLGPLPGEHPQQNSRGVCKLG
jgi:polar amino acid transport system substrate-binding protein